MKLASKLVFIELSSGIAIGTDDPKSDGRMDVAWRTNGSSFFSSQGDRFQPGASDLERPLGPQNDGSPRPDINPNEKRLTRTTPRAEATLHRISVLRFSPSACLVSRVMGNRLIQGSRRDQMGRGEFCEEPTQYCNWLRRVLRDWCKIRR